jgi:hypothetical protein
MKSKTRSNVAVADNSTLVTLSIFFIAAASLSVVATVTAIVTMATCDTSAVNRSLITATNAMSSTVLWIRIWILISMDQH